MEHPGKQINLGSNSHRSHDALLVFLGDDSSTVPLKEPVQRAQRGIHRNLHEFPVLDARCCVSVAGGLGTGQSHVSGVRNDLGDLVEVEHGVGDGALSRYTSVGYPTKDIAQGDEASKSLSGRREHG